MSQPPPPHTPVRRISRGSLFALSRSSSSSDAPHGLGFLPPALAEFADEAEATTANLRALSELNDNLASFNNSFASYLYMLKMNSLTVDWPRAPTDASLELARRRAEQAALTALQQAQQARPPTPPRRTRSPSVSGTEQDPNATVVSTSSRTTTTSKGRRGAKPKLSVKEKKERNLYIEKIVNSLPLEFRGGDPTLRRHIELVIEPLMDRAGSGVRLQDLIQPPDLNQARVNKCLIALVNRKIVLKDNATGQVLYHWRGLPE